ncbi:dimethylarginine dimethylaminohydrolase family protein, partial [candidate division KSB1 bacterium]
MKYGSQSETGKIHSVLLKRPEDAFIDQENIDKQWKNLNYSGRPDFDKAVGEYNEFISLLKAHVPEICFLPANDDTGLDSVYTHDPVVITERGIILCNMGKKARCGEQGAAACFLRELGIPVLGVVSGAGKLEGGDVVWLDKNTVAVGNGYRTNTEGIGQFRKMIQDFVDDIIEVQLPHWNGPGDVLHLMSLISPVDRDLAVVYSRLLPVPFRELLIGRGMKLIEVPDDEYEKN